MSDATEFPSSMGAVAPRELAVHGITGVDQLTAKTEKQLLAMHGLGPTAIRILRDPLAQRRLRYAGE